MIAANGSIAGLVPTLGRVASDLKLAGRVIASKLDVDLSFLDGGKLKA